MIYMTLNACMRNEEGCLSYYLYNKLAAAGVKCVILIQQGQGIKADSREVFMIFRCLPYGGASCVYFDRER